MDYHEYNWSNIWISEKNCIRDLKQKSYADPKEIPVRFERSRTKALSIVVPLHSSNFIYILENHCYHRTSGQYRKKSHQSLSRERIQSSVINRDILFNFLNGGRISIFSRLKCHCHLCEIVNFTNNNVLTLIIVSINLMKSDLGQMH